MIYEMKEELLVAQGSKKSKHRGFIIDGLQLEGVHDKIVTGMQRDKSCKWGVALKCKTDFWQLKKIEKAKDRKSYLVNNKNILRHQSMACLFVNNQIVAFPTVNRDEDLLAKNPPVVVVQFSGEAATISALILIRR